MDSLLTFNKGTSARKWTKVIWEMETPFFDKNFAKIMYAFYLTGNFIKISILWVLGDRAYWDSLLLSSFLTLSTHINIGQNIATKNLNAIPKLKIKKEFPGSQNQRGKVKPDVNFEIWCCNASERYWSETDHKGWVTGDLIFMFFGGQGCGLGLL